MNQPDFPSNEQRVLISRAEAGESFLVVAGPGTGKSQTALEIASQKIRSLAPSSRAQVLFLSFSNATINRLVASAGYDFSVGDRKHLRFMTFHSCASELLIDHGRFVGLPYPTKVADKLEERLVSIEEGQDEDSDTYDEFIHLLAKNRGLLSFDCLLPLGSALLSASATLRSIYARHYPLIIVDEFQDTSEEQWTFLKILGENSQVIAFGDPNQIIYSSLHRATERRLAEFEGWKSTSADTSLAKNFRCSQRPILGFAGCLLQGIRFAPEVSAPVKFEAVYRNQLRPKLALLWKLVQDKIGPKQNIGILLPSNALVEEVASELRNPPADSQVRFPVYAQMARDEAAYDAVLLTLAALKDYSVYPSEHFAKKAAVALLAMNRSWNSKSRISMDRVTQIAQAILPRRRGDGTMIGQLFESLHTQPKFRESVTPLIAALGELPSFKEAAKRIMAHPSVVSTSLSPLEPQLSLFDQILKTRSPKGLEGETAFEGKTHILTYHKAKGREFDYVLLVVDPRQESSHTPLTEKRRLYYVVATRAKKWLGVVYFKNDHGSVLGPTLGRT